MFASLVTAYPLGLSNPSHHMTTPPILQAMSYVIPTIQTNYRFRAVCVHRELICIHLDASAELGKKGALLHVHVLVPVYLKRICLDLSQTTKPAKFGLPQELERPKACASNSYSYLAAVMNVAGAIWNIDSKRMCYMD
jgi:hypothetical protein